MALEERPASRYATTERPQQGERDRLQHIGKWESYRPEAQNLSPFLF